MFIGGTFAKNIRENNDENIGEAIAEKWQMAIAEKNKLLRNDQRYKKHVES